jgi:hypothetical protein
MDNMELVDKDNMNSEVVIKSINNLPHSGDEDRGYYILRGAQGIIPVNIIKLTNGIKKLIAKVGDGSINSEKEGFDRSEQLRMLKGAEIELEKATKKCLEPLREIEAELMDCVLPVKHMVKEKKVTLGNTLGVWVGNVRRKNTAEAEELADTRRKQKDADIAEKNRIAKLKDEERLVKVEERKKAERERLKKEKELLKIETKIEEIKDNEEELGQDVFDKTLEELTKQKNDTTNEYKEIETVSLKKREIARTAVNDALLAKGEVNLLEQEKEAIVAVPELVKLTGVNVAEYDAWEVVNMEELPDEWAIITKIEDREKINKAFKKDPGMEIRGIRKFKKYIPRATPIYSKNNSDPDECKE